MIFQFALTLKLLCHFVTNSQGNLFDKCFQSIKRNVYSLTVVTTEKL